jgi:response regulator RpfG family c-di-GMP phosphodiesterase
LLDSRRPFDTVTTLTSVLIVDDEPALRDLMARWAVSLGLEPTTAASSEEALERLRSRPHDLAVIDIVMPGHNGLWLVEELRRAHPEMPVVLATGYTERLAEADTYIADFLVKPIRRERFALAVDRGRKWRDQSLEESRWHRRMAEDFDASLAEILTLVRGHGEWTPEDEFLSTLASKRVPDVMPHGDRVAFFSRLIAREIGLDNEALVVIERAARFHDIGKAAVPLALLSKPSRMTAAEIALMQRHVEAGADILEATKTLSPIAPIVRASHEWFGGGGYPATLSGQAIPLASRIIAIGDAYDAMTQTRSYRAQLGRNEAVAELLRSSPAQFDPDLVVAFLTVLTGNRS